MSQKYQDISYPSSLDTGGKMRKEDVAPHDCIFIAHTLATEQVWEQLFDTLGQYQVVLLNTLIKDLCIIELQITRNLSKVELLQRALDPRWNVYRGVANTVEEFRSRMYERLTRVILDYEDQEPATIQQIYTLLDLIKN